MKVLTACCLFSLCLLFSFKEPRISDGRTLLKNPLLGAWLSEKAQQQHLLLFTNRHYSYTVYDKTGKKFYHTEGGTYQFDGTKLSTRLEFNSSDPKGMGKESLLNAQVAAKQLQLNWPVEGTNWKRIDEAGGPLNATWRITGREQQGTMNTIQPSARKTIKLLTAKRFQWAAINTATGEFFGTGGGTYTFKDGVYTEHIDFFSRDSSRVGMSLSFEGQVQEANWHHRGKSSKGDPIYEIWSKED
ncbi:hypothetical protein [Flavihumibacter sp. CACIAM 22H1]|uniref:hypothetical protein n=1 Tax=Flavihumibacter sp. CACIAM 22H1 TaxID=1812911 RepID=UPI0007A933CA|nr:hypothetical protein [Flavihumibacter sp. CACIAM 22H1]KYP14662.1 MAG: hypothetical protein A1D16_05050 [Flavihumibacter sp. CACIAM 22H1]